MSPRGLLVLLILGVLGLLPELGGGHRDPPSQGDPKNHRESPKNQRGTLGVWVQTLGATLGVSLAPQALLFLVPGDSGSPRRRGLLRGLLSFAAGGLLGDAFLHLIPHALAPHEHHAGHDHSHHGHAPHEHHAGHGHSHHGHAPHEHHAGHGHSHHGHDPHAGHGHSHHGHGHALWVGLWVLVGIVTFLGVELGVRHFGVRGHGHAHGSPHKAKVSSSEDEADGDTKGGSKVTKGHPRRSPDRERAGMAASGYLNLAADAAHNFTDGLALGAAFWGGPGRGVLTALTVLLHELPHELGDLALLLRAGCTKAQAMKLQLVTALAALAGASCSLLAEGSSQSSQSSQCSQSGAGISSGILPFTAGGFIYLGTVSVIPEILRNSGPFPALLQLLALLAGLAMMLMIAIFE